MRSPFSKCAWLAALAIVGCNSAIHSPGYEAPRVRVDAPAVVLAEVDVAAAPVEVALAQAPAGAQTTPAAKGPGFSFPNDSGGKLLAEKLVPARPATPVPFVAGPRPARPLEMEIAGTAGTWLAPLAPVAPRGLMPPASGGKPRPLVDLPALAKVALEPAALPTLVPLPMLAKAYAASLDANKIPPLSRGPKPTQPLPTPASDPTAEASLAALLAPVSGGRATPAPAIRLEVPDPFGIARSIELRAHPAEVAPPFAPTSAPRPTLPVDPVKPAETKTGGG